MSELMNGRSRGWDFRWQLLASVSTAALVASAYAPVATLADDGTDRPTVWIELGGQLEQMQDGQEPLAPPFVANMPNTFFSPLSVQKPLLYSVGGQGSISFESDGSDWVFSASVLYGRSNGTRQKHQQTPNAKVPVNFNLSPPYSAFHFGPEHYYPSSHIKFEDAAAKQSESHAVIDFQAGKDVGLGMFGSSGSSVLSAGVRFAQFTSTANIKLRAEPDVHYPSAPLYSEAEKYAFNHTPIHFHDYAAMLSAQRSFRGLGPSIAWNASAPFLGNPDAGEMTLDWGANAAVLFGRQKANGHHQTTVRSYYRKGYHRTVGIQHFNLISTSQHSHAAAFNRTRAVVVPNLGGFAGLSYRFTNAKLSLGYRADFFFGAIDGGIDTSKSENRGFYGPFATISVGFGG